ncbi:peptidoglycan DD-metalloendopeptidase family protein [Streptomyces sp. NPDC051907]|uniref:peptidoglycan DD-metalloendopeptidase family protein n=1 Tax=Streptomyces sp. NPDC051907 TaxID=3155284 RepID=UPI00341B1CD2
MAAFTIDMSSPLRASAFTSDLGGPGGGTHGPGEWYNHFGMDLGAPAGSEVRAAFDGHITRLNPHIPSTDTSGSYGAEVFVRAHNDRMGGFYTHITNVPSALAIGSTVSRGDRLGDVMAFPGVPTHVHWALVEIIGGLPGGTYKGVNLHGSFVAATRSDSTLAVTFHQNGSAPAAI